MHYYTQFNIIANCENTIIKYYQPFLRKGSFALNYTSNLKDTNMFYLLY